MPSVCHPRKSPFCDVLADNEGAVEAMGNDKFRVIASELVDQLQSNAITDLSPVRAPFPYSPLGNHALARLAWTAAFGRTRIVVWHCAISRLQGWRHWAWEVR